jgi:gas vesicle protein GvpA/GvpJ/GvpM family
MRPLVANTDDLISVLDRVLDKGIVLESWARLSLHESSLTSVDARVPSASRISVESSRIYVGYGNRGAWREDRELEHLFPYWRRDLWRK